MACSLILLSPVMQGESQFHFSAKRKYSLEIQEKSCIVCQNETVNIMWFRCAKYAQKRIFWQVCIQTGFHGSPFHSLVCESAEPGTWFYGIGLQCHPGRDPLPGKNRGSSGSCQDHRIGTETKSKVPSAPVFAHGKIMRQLWLSSGVKKIK